MKSDKTIGFLQAPKENSTEGYCSWWIKFIDIVLHLPYTKRSSDQFIDKLQTYYKGNNTKLATLEKFKTYQSCDAAKWYTEDFLYRIVNNALRRRNVQVILLIGFFLQDLYRQVAEEHEKQKIEYFNQRLFRGQKIGFLELESKSTGLK
jgi:hypothetical protein